jgi:hypothetical protein
MDDQESRKSVQSQGFSGAIIPEGRLTKTKSAEEMKSPQPQFRMTKPKASKIETYNEYFERVLAEGSSPVSRLRHS